MSMQRPNSTILLLTRNVLVRADFSPGRAKPKIMRRPRPEVADWTALIEPALALGGKPGKRVYILSSDLWTQTLSLPTLSTTNMAEDELAAALNFEAESLSGVNALEAKVAVRTLPAGAGFWIVQARAGDIEQADTIVRLAGGRLAGLTHPGGLHAREDGAKPSCRIEFWPDAVLLQRRTEDDQTSIQVLNSDPQMGRWKNDWESWREKSGGVRAQEALFGPGMAVAPPDATQVIALEDEATLSAWLGEFALQLDRKATPVPLLKAPKKPMSAGARAAFAFGLPILAVVLCAACQFWLDRSLQNLRADIKRTEEPTKHLADLKKRTLDLESKRHEMQPVLVQLDQAEKVLGTQRARLSRLLDKLRHHQDEHLYVKAIHSNDGEPRLEGLCLQPELADQFANKLAVELLDQGWEVRSPKKKALKLAEDGGPWTFEITLKTPTNFYVDKAPPTAKKGLVRSQ